MKQDSRIDRGMLFGLAAIALGTLAYISYAAGGSRIPSDSQTLMGTIVAGLLLFARDIVQAIRAFWQDERSAVLTDHLAAAPAPTSDSPQPVTVTNTPENPVQTETVP